jgi:hypothetical protein
MKIFKFILILFITVSITSCSSEEGEPTITLSNANIVGSYDISKLNIVEVESATSSAGVTVELSKNTKIGDTFQVELEIKSNGTFTASGEYRSTSTVVPTPTNGQEDPKIININSSGSYELNTSLNTINFTQNEGDFIDGSFDITTFNETTVIMNQEATDIQGGITNEIKTNITFTRQ